LLPGDIKRGREAILGCLERLSVSLLPRQFALDARQLGETPALSGLDRPGDGFLDCGDAGLNFAGASQTFSHGGQVWRVVLHETGR
jgi:hypothetical protein